MKHNSEILTMLNDFIMNNINLCLEVRQYWSSEKTQKKVKNILCIKTSPHQHDYKRNRSAYIFFFKHKRLDILKENPQFTSKEIMKIIGFEWKNMSDKEKEIYEKEAQEDKNRYENTKKKKTNTSNKNNLKSYILFCKTHRPQIKSKFPNEKAKEITSKVSKLWNEYKLTNVQYLIDNFEYIEKTKNSPVFYNKIDEIKNFIENDTDDDSSNYTLCVDEKENEKYDYKKENNDTDDDGSSNYDDRDDNNYNVDNDYD